MSVTDRSRYAQTQARAAGRTLWIICGLIALIVAIIVAARMLAGQPIAALSLALPAIGLAWLAGLGLRVHRYRAPAESVAVAEERPSRRPPAPRFEPSGGPRSERGSDSGRQVSA